MKPLLGIVLVLVTLAVLLGLPFVVGPEGKPLCHGPWKQSYGRGPWMYLVCSSTPYTPGVVWTENDGVAWWHECPQP